VTQTEQSRASQAPAQPEELKNLNYEFLLLGYSLLSVFNVVVLFFTRDETVANIITIIDTPLTIIFFVDFVIRFRSAESKRSYFFRQFGWADLLASLPFPAFKILRMFRVFRAWRMIQHYGARNLRRQLREHRADAALAVLAFLIMCVLEFGGIAITVAERTSPAANIKTASDAIWWAFVTITTVGYGDRYPVTGWGRIVGTVVLMTGVGLFGVLTGYLANAFLAPPKQAEEKKQAAAQAAQTLAQVDSQVILLEMKRLISEQEKTQEELRAMLAELKEVAR